MNDLLTVIRIDPAHLEDITEDLVRFYRVGLLGVNFEIPLIKTLAVERGKARGVKLVDRPLLLSYGFLRMPVNIAKNPARLSQIKSMSRFIRGFLYRSEEDLELERLSMELENLGSFGSVLVKTISEEELKALYQTALDLGVRNFSEEVGVGDYVILRGYPVDGLAAQVLRKKSHKKVEVELLSSGMTLWINSENIFYSESCLEDIP